MSATVVLTREIEKPAVGQLRGPATEKQKNAAAGSFTDKALLAFVAMIVIWFAPISFTYFLGKTHVNYIGDKMLASLVSWEFAYGKGSGQIDQDGQYSVLLRNVTAMLLHSISGTVAIVTGLAQFNRTLQFKYPIIHRSLGRLYGLCAMIICWSSVSFLADAIPKKDVFSGELFALILSMLNFGVFTTMILAVYAIWNRDIGSHREFMMLNYSLMLSAPFLRVCWVVIGRLWGETKMTVNLYSAIFAGPFLLETPIFYLRRRYSRPMNATLISTRLRLAVIASSLMSLLFLAPRLSSLEQWSYRPAADFWFVAPQWVFQAVSFTTLAWAAKRRGDMRAYTAWTTYQNGLVCGPVFAVPTYYLCRHVFLCPNRMMGLCTFVGGWMGGLSAAYITYVTATSTFANPHNHAIHAL